MNRASPRPPRTYWEDDVPSDVLMRHHRLNEKEREIAEEVATTIAVTRGQSLRYPDDDGRGFITPDDVIESRIPKTRTRRKYHVMTAALALAKERGVDMTSRPAQQVSPQAIQQRQYNELAPDKREALAREYESNEDATYASMACKYGIAETSVYRILREYRGEAA